MNKNIKVGFVAILVIATIGLFLPTGKPITKEIIRETVETVGASPGDKRFNPCETTNGIESCFTQELFRTATTTLCSLKSPVATSTIRLATFHVSGGTTTAAYLEAGISTTGNNATTTRIGLLALAASARGTLIATSTTAGLTIEGVTIAPNSHINFNFGGAPGGIVTNLAMTGTCQATFTTVQ